MSPTGRYQSRLFNLFSRQSRRLGDRVAVGWRQAKTALAWSGQILLYPIYAAYQTTRLVSQQIEQTVQRVLPQLRGQPFIDDELENNDLEEIDETLPLTADAPILQTLMAAQEILPLVHLTPAELAEAGSLAIPQTGSLTILEGSRRNIDTTQTSAAQTQQPIRVQGLASLLATRSLVLVTVHNQILDVLTPQQQTQLEQRMIWALASYWRSRHFALHQRLAKLLPPLPPNRPHLLPPVRLLRRLMAWVQTSPVAVAANLFREAELMTVIAPARFERVGLPKLSPASEPLPSQNPRSLPASPPVEGYRAWQNWFSRRFTSPKSPTVDESMRRDDAADPPPPLPAPAVADSWERWLNRVLRAPTATGGAADGAAMVSDRALPIVIASPSILTSPQTKRRRGRSVELQDQSQENSPPIPVKGGATVSLPSVGQNWRLARNPSQPVPAPDSRSIDVAPHPSRERPEAAIAVQDAQTSPTAAPEWIEAEARLVGYVKHPLERVLAWLDAGMLWLEKALAQLWRSIGQRGS